MMTAAPDEDRITRSLLLITGHSIQKRNNEAFMRKKLLKIMIF